MNLNLIFIASVGMFAILFSWPVIGRFIEESVGYRGKNRRRVLTYIPVWRRRLTLVVILLVIAVLLSSYLYGKSHPYGYLVGYVVLLIFMILRERAGYEDSKSISKNVDSGIFWENNRQMVVCRWLILFLLGNMVWVIHHLYH